MKIHGLGRTRKYFLLYFQIEISLKYWLSKVEKCRKGDHKAKIKVDGSDFHFMP